MDNKITGAEALIRGLIAEGVDTVFGYPGGAIMPVYDKLYDFSDTLNHILTRHEQGAIHAAEGFARVSKRTGVVIVTSGPAATNVMTGLSDATMDSTPLVVITGQVSASLLGSDAFQETDVVGITQPISKWAYQIRHAKDIAWAVSRAFFIANSGRPGPVVLDFAKNAQEEMIEFEPYHRCKFIRSYIPYPTVYESDLRRVADIINDSSRPMIISGHGVMIAGAEDQLATLAEKADIPVASTMLGLSTMPSDHPLFKGMVGMHGNIGPNYNTNRADLIVAIGMRFDDRVTGNTKLYAPQAKIVHIDIDESEFNKNIRAHATIHGDAREVLTRIIPLVREAKHTKWLKSFELPEAVEREKVTKDAVFRDDPQGLPCMGEVAYKVSMAAGHDSVLVTDVGQNQLLSVKHFKYTSPRSVITSGGLGTMGYGLPAAIGAKMAAPHRQVCFFTGDGGMQMTIQELGTIMQYQTAVKIIILNNNFLGNVRQWQVMFYNNRLSQTPMVNPDYPAIAKAYGIEAETVERREQLDAAIERMLKHNGAYILNVMVDENDMVFPMTPGGQAVDYILLNQNEVFDPSSKK
ncbi:MAG: biosynthetic-type acetolactate synthase large subunit [Muribaculaceae bacterium]|nr:biosynthetic-type acetolactate synthase large subunit [Muribaculaceae bacterium]